jgi:spore coat-associated protein N
MSIILRSAFVIAVVAAVAGGATYAWFTSQANMNNNTFSAGTLSISLSNPNGSLPFTITNWAPGKTTELRLDVKNTGTLDAKVTGTVSGTWDGGLGDHYVSVKSIEYWNGTAWVSASPNLLIGAGQTLPIKAVVEFNSAAGNDYQGRTYWASFSVNATQPEAI